MRVILDQSPTALAKRGIILGVFTERTDPGGPYPEPAGTAVAKECSFWYNVKQIGRDMKPWQALDPMMRNEEYRTEPDVEYAFCPLRKVHDTVAYAVAGIFNVLLSWPKLGCGAKFARNP